jgi:transposase
MDIVTVFVGLDYHKSLVQVCVLDKQGKIVANRQCDNDAGQIVDTVSRHGDRVFAAIEACTGAAHLADELSTQSGWSVDLAHPGYVARLKQSPDKSDYSDARLLADLERVGYLPKVWLAPEGIRELRRLVRYRHQRAAERRKIKLRVSALLREHRLNAPYRSWTRAWKHWLLEEVEVGPQSRWIIERHVEQFQAKEEELRAVERRLAELTADDVIVERLMEIGGIGLVTAVTIRAEIGRFDRFRNGKQLARFCGLSPRNASSGQRQADAGLIKAGNPELRRILVEAAHRLTWREPRWSEMNQRLCEKGKPKSVVVAAVANRFVRWLYHQMQPQTTA